MTRKPTQGRSTSNGPIDTIVRADAIEFLTDYAGPAPSLIFADPPFNIGYEYDHYDDNREHEAYVAWTRRWMQACRNALHEQGSFYIAIGDEYAAEVCLAGKELGLTLRNWIIWHYTFGQSTKRKFARAHVHIFYFVNDPKRFTFNDHLVRVPSDRQLIYNDRRANPAGKLPDDVWKISRVCGTFNERVQWHPCQMPEALLERIVVASSNPGELVFDPFSGSGTTLAVARRLGRRYLGVDVSEDYVRWAQKRLAGVRPEPERFNAPLPPIPEPDRKRAEPGRQRRAADQASAEPADAGGSTLFM